jgi:hypothetical protein
MCCICISFLNEYILKWNVSYTLFALGLGEGTGVEICLHGQSDLSFSHTYFRVKSLFLDYPLKKTEGLSMLHSLLHEIASEVA